jgi:hypothetical protein
MNRPEQPRATHGGGDTNLRSGAFLPAATAAVYFCLGKESFGCGESGQTPLVLAVC